jgi:hypothetical protein
MVAYACHLSCARGINRRMVVQMSPEQKCETLFKKYLKEKGVGMWLK